MQNKNNSQPQSSFFTIDLKMHQINRLRLYRAPKTDKHTKKKLPSCERKAAQSNVFRYFETSLLYFVVLFVRKRLSSEIRLHQSKINDFCYSQRLLGRSGGTFGRSWGSLGRSWPLLGRSWPLLAALGRPWPAFGRS